MVFLLASPLVIFMINFYSAKLLYFFHFFTFFTLFFVFLTSCFVIWRGFDVFFAEKRVILHLYI